MKKLLLLFFVILLSYVSAKYFGLLYFYFIPLKTGLYSFSLDAIIFIIGIVNAYTFFNAFLYTMFGDKHKYWWIGILLIPAAAFEVYFNFEHIYFPIILGALGWLIGQGILKLKIKS